MSSSLYRLGQRSAHHPWRVVGVGLLIAAIVLGILSQLGGTSNPFDAHAPSVSADGRTAFSTVDHSVDALDPAHTEATQQAADLARAEEDKAEFGGWRVPIDIEGNKGVGLPVAVLVLLFAFGSLATDHRNLPGPSRAEDHRQRYIPKRAMIAETTTQPQVSTRRSV